MALSLAAVVGIFLLAYLLGSIPPGYLAGRWLKGIDIREEGSGSTGATNVLRTVGKGPALVVFLLDILKGTGAVMLGAYLYDQLATPLPPLDAPWVGCISGVIALLGHSKPVWLSFRGGKSVATALGVVFGMNWLVALGTFGIFGITLALFRIVSLGSLAGAIGVNALMWATGQPLAYKFFALMSALSIFWRHQANIQRLVAGTEPKIGQPIPQKAEVS
ncbi:glycerol-3-phosphate 1-O-acyltransferase PlsY [Prochlorothrix hollandica]|uniref:Glycerol-3-phosphate acyltransferase n=1 Tax=Prochlorothrix hollandica PCC 9006 = CALU 1027 TaxID=317619 RepID=A0A0M2PSB3_PROHO|nr:glycerol-3-phosphate 1-O-acyltransferase PlsY [Prochlorothrix hollandica]KKI99014.1 glycerol-3-phosphate acyltransferase [Prochlorothrix hollandica PCC 9006 = CALU 1027]